MMIALTSEADQKPQKYPDLADCDQSDIVLSPVSAGSARMPDQYASSSCPEMLSAELTLSSRLDPVHLSKMRSLNRQALLADDRPVPE